MNKAHRFAGSTIDACRSMNTEEMTLHSEMLRSILRFNKRSFCHPVVKLPVCKVKCLLMSFNSGDYNPLHWGRVRIDIAVVSGMYS